jgi:hypothetical protein
VRNSPVIVKVMERKVRKRFSITYGRPVRLVQYALPYAAFEVAGTLTNILVSTPATSDFSVPSRVDILTAILKGYCEAIWNNVSRASDHQYTRFSSGFHRLSDAPIAAADKQFSRDKSEGGSS